MTIFVAIGPPFAAAQDDGPPAAKTLMAQPRATAEKAASIARRETGGRVLSVTNLPGGEGGHRVRLLLDGGRVVTVNVDPGGGVRRPRP